MSDDPITRLNAALEGRYRIERELGEGSELNRCALPFVSARFLGRERRRSNGTGNVVWYSTLCLTLLAATACSSDSGTEPAARVPTTITLSPSSASLSWLGEAVQLGATVLDQDGAIMSGQTVTWTATDEGVASVSSGGLTTAVGNGTATIDATSGSVTAAVSVTVQQLADTVAVSPDPVVLGGAGSTATASALVLDAGGNEIVAAVVTWSLDEPSVATVSNAGVVLGVAPGLTMVTATADAVVGTATVIVVGTVTRGLVSDASWEVFDADPAAGAATNLGSAQNVCLNASNPPSCPAGAVLYGWDGGGWGTDLSAIPGAAWIWGPGVTGQSISTNAEFYFSVTFDLAGSPTEGRIFIAADDFAELLVNGASVGTIGSTTDVGAAGQAQAALKEFDVLSLLVSGSNRITVRAVNGVFGSCCTYAGAPAGVVFGGFIRGEVIAAVRE